MRTLACCCVLIALGCAGDKVGGLGPSATGAAAGGVGGTNQLADAAAPKQPTVDAAAHPAPSAGAHDAGSAHDAGAVRQAGDVQDAGTGTGGAKARSTGTTSAGAGAPEAKALGYGKAATGGGNSAPMRVATLAAAQAAIDAYSGRGGLVLEYTGRFDFSTITDPCVQHTLAAQKLEIKKKSDLTILGVDGSAANFGIHVSSAASNVIIRNMTIGLLPGGGDSDMISLEGMSGGVPTDIWIDHNELFSSMADCPGAGDTAFDGMIDIKKGADNVTISYNYMHDHHKMSLNGFSDDDSAIRHVTFHHNLFENIGSRTPLQRHGYSHVLNNYLIEIVTSGINVRMDGYSLVEGNYFENVQNPVTSRDSPMVGYWDLRDNNLATKADVAAGNSFGITWDDGSSGTVNATEWVTTAAFPVALGYSYTADPFACVHDGLRAVVGSGKGLPTLECR